jgi:hypothetical protein
MGKIIAAVVVVWLIIGIIAAAQRGYFRDNNDTSCAQATDTAITIVAGPLNYVGANPKVKCSVPQPSR